MLAIELLDGLLNLATLREQLLTLALQRAGEVSLRLRAHFVHFLTHGTGHLPPQLLILFSDRLESGHELRYLDACILVDASLTSPQSPLLLVQ